MILFQIEPDDFFLFNEIVDDPSIEKKIIDKKNFNGQTELIELLCSATMLSIPILGKIIIESIKSRRNIIIKHNGTTIKGLSQDNVTKILEKLIDKK